MANSKKKKRNKKIIYSVIFLFALIGITMYCVLKDFELKSIINILSEVKLEYVGIALFMVFMYVFLGGISLRESLKGMKTKITVRKSFVYSSIDYFFSGITPSASGGQPFQLYYMKKDDVSMTKTTIAVLINLIMYKMALMVLSLCAVIFFPEILAEAGTLGILLFIIGFVINIIAVTVCFMAIYWKSLISKIGRFGIYKLAKWKIVKNPDAKAASFEKKLEKYNKTAHYIKKRNGLKLFIINLVQRICLFSITFWCFKAMGFSHLSIYYLIAVQTIVSLAVDSMPLPGGVGLSEILLTTLFALVYPTETIQASALLLTRGICFFFLILFTGLFVLINHIRLILKGKHLDDDDDIVESLDDVNIEEEVLQ